MEEKFNINDIIIRTELKPGDIGYITYLHGALYNKEYNYGIEFETYVAEGLCEFYRKYDPLKDRVWICEHNAVMIGFLLIMNRDDSAQLRYFIIKPEYRGIGLGAKLINLYMVFLHQNNYKHSYLWTTNELPAAAHLYKKVGFKLTKEKESTSNFGKPVIEQRYDLYLEQ